MHRLRRISPCRRLSDAASLHSRGADSRRGPGRARELRFARPGWRRLSRGTQMAHRARGSGAAAHGGQYRRRRAGHLQGSLLPRARSAPLPRRYADRGLGSGHRGDLHLPARRVCGLPRDPHARARRARVRSSVPIAENRAPPRRGRVHLRGRVGDDRIDRGQARHAASSPALRGAGRALRPSHARAQYGDALLGSRNPRARRGLVRPPGPARPQGPALVLRFRTR